MLFSHLYCYKYSDFLCGFKINEAQSSIDSNYKIESWIQFNVFSEMVSEAHIRVKFS